MVEFLSEVTAAAAAPAETWIALMHAAKQMKCWSAKNKKLKHKNFVLSQHLCTK